MRKKLTAAQKYQHEYYLKHKDDKAFKERRARVKKAWTSKPSIKRKRNAKLRERWANDPEFRRKICEYQKAWRAKRKQAASRLHLKTQKSNKSNRSRK